MLIPSTIDQKNFGGIVTIDPGSRGGDSYFCLGGQTVLSAHHGETNYASCKFPTVVLTDSRVRNVVPTALERIITARGYPLYASHSQFKKKNSKILASRCCSAHETVRRARTPVTSNLSVLLPPPLDSHRRAVSSANVRGSNSFIPRQLIHTLTNNAKRQNYL